MKRRRRFYARITRAYGCHRYLGRHAYEVRLILRDHLCGAGQGVFAPTSSTILDAAALIVPDIPP